MFVDAISGWKKRLGFLGSLLISGALLWLTLRHTSWHDVGRIFQNSRWGWVVAGGLAFSASYAVKWWRWHLIVRGLVRDASPRQSLVPFFGGFALNNFLPFRAGEGFRILSVSRNTGMSRTSALSTLALDRVLDGLALFLLLATALGFIAAPAWVSNLFWTVGIVFAGGFVALLVLAKSHSPSRETTSCPERTRMSAPFRIFQSAVNGLQSIQRKEMVCFFLLLSIVVWGLEALMYLTVARALSLPLTIPGAFLLLSVVNFGILVPASPGYIGTFEFFMVKTLLLLQVSRDLAVSYTAIMHGSQFLLISIFGAVAWIGTAWSDMGKEFLR